LSPTRAAYIRDREANILWLSKLSLRELRERQVINTQMIKMADTDEQWETVREIQYQTDAAVSLQVFGEY
jgi:hypothetical protein